MFYFGDIVVFLVVEFRVGCWALVDIIYYDCLDWFLLRLGSELEEYWFVKMGFGFWVGIEVFG